VTAEVEAGPDGQPEIRKPEIGRRELIALLAMATALTALGIDLMLPAVSYTHLRAHET